MPADSLILASANLLLIGVLFVFDWIPTDCCMLGILAFFIWFVVVPFLFLTSLFFVIKDLVQRRARWQVVLALILSVAIGVMRFFTRYSKF